MKPAPGTLFLTQLPQDKLSIYTAIFGREEILVHAGELFVSAKAQGIKFGREPMERPESFDKIREMWLNNGISVRVQLNTLALRIGLFCHGSMKANASRKKRGVKYTLVSKQIHSGHSTRAPTTDTRREYLKLLLRQALRPVDNVYGHCSVYEAICQDAADNNSKP